MARVRLRGTASLPFLGARAAVSGCPFSARALQLVAALSARALQ
jgi:hypothetical protein